MCDLVPLSHLALDLEPPAGVDWPSYLGRRGIRVMPDDLGRMSVSRADARRLFEERQQSEARAREAAEQAAIAAEERWLAQLRPGIPASAIPEGVSAATFMMESDCAGRPKRRSMLQDALSGDTLTVHPIHQPAFEDE